MTYNTLTSVEILLWHKGLVKLSRIFQNKLAVCAIFIALLCCLHSNAQAQTHNGDLRDECRSNVNNFEWVLSQNITEFGIFDNGYNMLGNIIAFIVIKVRLTDKTARPLAIIASRTLPASMVL